MMIVRGCCCGMMLLWWRRWNCTRLIIANHFYKRSKWQLSTHFYLNPPKVSPSSRTNGHLNHVLELFSLLKRAKTFLNCAITHEIIPPPPLSKMSTYCQSEWNLFSSIFSSSTVTHPRFWPLRRMAWNWKMLKPDYNFLHERYITILPGPFFSPKHKSKGETRRRRWLAVGHVVWH